MTRKQALGWGSAVAALVVIATALALGALGSTSKNDRAVSEASEENFFAALGPNTTFHTKQRFFSAENGTSSGEAFQLPIRYESETWGYFGPDGGLAEFFSEARELESGAVVQRTELVGGDLVFTDIASGETRTIPGYSIRAETLRARMQSALESSRDAAAAAGQDGEVTTSTVGKPKRTSFDTETGATRKWERVSVDESGAETIVESRENLTFEVLPGRVMR